MSVRVFLGHGSSGLAPAHAAVYLNAQQAGNRSQKEPVPARTRSHRCDPGSRAGIAIACPTAAATWVPPSRSPTSLYPSESARNNRMGLISWLQSQLWVSGVGDWGPWKPGMEKDIKLEVKGQEKGSVWKETVRSGLAQPRFPLRGQGLGYS